MKSTTADGSQSQVPPVAPRPRLDRIAAATFEQLSAALIFLSAFSPDAFDYAMDAAESGSDERAAAAEAEPVCAACGGKIGIFIERGLAWRHYTGDGMTAGQQDIYDADHAAVVTWRFPEDSARG